MSCAPRRIAFRSKLETASRFLRFSWVNIGIWVDSRDSAMLLFVVRKVEGQATRSTWLSRLRHIRYRQYRAARGLKITQRSAAGWSMLSSGLSSASRVGNKPFYERAHAEYPKILPQLRYLPSLSFPNEGTHVHFLICQSSFLFGAVCCTIDLE